MPYIVTTKRPDETIVGHGGGFIVSRRAVATLDRIPGGARNMAKTIVLAHNAGYPFIGQANEIPESGGTVGPLPDGSLIEVEAVSMDALAPAAVIADLHDNGFTDSEIIAAFNAKQAA